MESNPFRRQNQQPARPNLCSTDKTKYAFCQSTSFGEVYVSLEDTSPKPSNNLFCCFCRIKMFPAQFPKNGNTENKKQIKPTKNSIEQSYKGETSLYVQEMIFSKVSSGWYCWTIWMELTESAVISRWGAETHYFQVLAVCVIDEREGIMSSRYSLWRASTVAAVLWPVRLGLT